ncbi:hypothetical protein [Oceanobacillus halophilus]|nr:hypothetical protein [Oceanobacillus halophilus]
MTIVMLPAIKKLANHMIAKLRLTAKSVLMIGFTFFQKNISLL